MQRAAIPVAAGALVLALAFPSSGADLPKPGLAATNGVLAVGAPAPPLAGTDAAGRPVRADAFKGRPVLVDFGSLFCASCQETIKELAQLEQAYNGTDLAIVVVTDGAVSPEAMRGIFARVGATYTVIRDEEGKLFESFGVRLIPFQVAIDREGIVRRIHNGFTAELETVLGLRELAGRGAEAVK